MSKAIKVEIAHQEYYLEIEVADYTRESGKTWTQVGGKYAKPAWAKINLNSGFLALLHNTKYRVIEVTHYKPVKTVAEEGVKE